MPPPAPKPTKPATPPKRTTDRKRLPGRRPDSVKRIGRWVPGFHDY